MSGRSSWWQRFAWILDGAWLKRRRWYLLATAVSAIGLAFVVLRPLLSARWSLIDDHESIEFYDQSPSHGPRWFFHAVRVSEAWNPGGGSRYRPTYYVLRIAETGLWHGSARLWWFAHAVKFALSMLLLIWALRRVTAIWENLAVTIWMVGALTWWGDIYCRLGPAEAYCVPALALYTWGALAALQTARSGQLPRYHKWCGAALAIGGVIAVGGKENMAFLLLPSMYLAARARWRGSRRWITIGCAIHVAFGMFCAIATYIGVSRHGHIYKEEISNAGRLALVTSAARSLVFHIWPWITVALIGAGGALLAAKRNWLVLAKLLAPPAAIIAFAFIVWLSQRGFYTQWPPSIRRYSFPGALAGPVSIYACYVAVVRTARFFDVRAAVAVRVLALGLITWRLFSLDYSVHAQAKVIRDSTVIVTKRIHRLTTDAHRKPLAPIVCVSNSVWDYEPIHAVQVFLRHAHVANPVYMIQRYSPSQFPEGSLERSLATTMEQTARDGSDGGLFPLTRPFAFQGGSGGCIGIGFSGDTGLADCPALVKF